MCVCVYAHTPVLVGVCVCCVWCPDHQLISHIDRHQRRCELTSRGGPLGMPSTISHLCHPSSTKLPCPFILKWTDGSIAVLWIAILRWEKIKLQKRSDIVWLGDLFAVVCVCVGSVSSQVKCTGVLCLCESAGKARRYRVCLFVFSSYLSSSSVFPLQSSLHKLSPFLLD